MATKLLGILDIFAAIMVALLIFGIKSPLTIVAIVYLIVKSLIFFGGVSIVDLIVAAIMFYAFLKPVNSLVLIVASLWLLQKGAASFLT